MLFVWGSVKKMDEANIDLLIFGAGGHATVCRECAADYRNPLFLYKEGDLSGMRSDAAPEELHSLQQWKSLCHRAFVAIGDNHIRADVSERLTAAGFELVSLIHPRAIISPSAEIAAGVLVSAGAIVNAGARLERGCIINSGAIVEHGCTVSAYAHLSPAAKLGGNTCIGQKTWICIGATVIDGIHVGNESILAAGSTLLVDLPDRMMAAGVPAKMKHRIKEVKRSTKHNEE